MKDWRKRFRSFWTAINKDYELNFETGDDRRVSGEVEDFIFSVLTTQKESFIKIIESQKRGQMNKPREESKYDRIMAEESEPMPTGKKMKEEIQIKINETERYLGDLKHKLWEIKDNEKIARAEFIKNNYKLKPEHKKLLKEMEFEGIWYGDIVSIGVDGKRPFGNSDCYGDIARILDWKLPNDDLSDEQREKASVLLEELPLALNEMLAESE